MMQYDISIYIYYLQTLRNMMTTRECAWRRWKALQSLVVEALPSAQSAQSQLLFWPLIFQGSKRKTSNIAVSKYILNILEKSILPSSSMPCMPQFAWEKYRNVGSLLNLKTIQTQSCRFEVLSIHVHMVHAFAS